MHSSAKKTVVNNVPDSQHSDCDEPLKLITIKPDNGKLRELVSTNQPVMIMVTLVISLHAGLLLLILNSSSEQQTTITVPTITGVLIQAPSTEPVKMPKKKPAPTPKHRPVLKKAITLPAVEKKSPEPDVQQTIDQTEEPADIEPQAAPIVAPRVDATRRSNPAPVYPRGSLRRNEQGKVILQVLILADGSVGEIQVKQSSGFKRLDHSAIKAVKRWRYIPAQQGSKAIEYWYQQPIVFSLRK